MAKPIRIGETKDYAEDDGTVWTIQILGSRVMSYLMELITRVKPESAQWARVAYEVVRWGLVGVKDFGDVKFSTISNNTFGKPMNVASDKFLDQIPVATLIALSGEIIKLNSPQEDESKNSSLQSSSPDLGSIAKPALVPNEPKEDAKLKPRPDVSG